MFLAPFTSLKSDALLKGDYVPCTQTRLRAFGLNALYEERICLKEKKNPSVVSQEITNRHESSIKI